MGAMVFASVGLLQIVVHDDGAPDDVTWARYMSESRHLLERADGDFRRLAGLIISDRGVPTSDQRADFKRFLDGHHLRSALVSSSVLVRAVVHSVNLFNPAMRPYPPRQLSAALRHLDVPPGRHREVQAALEQLAPRIPSAKALRELLVDSASMPHPA